MVSYSEGSIFSTQRMDRNVSIAALPPWNVDQPPPVPVRRFSVNEYHRLGEIGVLTEDDRVELLEGEIVEMTPIGSYHAACVSRLNRMLTLQLGQTAIVSVQNPIRLNDQSEPQPDITLLKPRPDFYKGGHPQPDDILLVIEVADSSVNLDRGTKLPLYAKAGISEVWIVDLTGLTVETYWQPSAQGYESISQLNDSEHVTSESFPALNISVKEILS